MADRNDTSPKVSVIIPVYNAEHTLNASIHSASRQSLADIEIICVDDCSSDGSPGILGDWADRDDRIRVIRHEENQGEGGARNTGLDAARGGYVFHLDSDDTIAPHALETLWSAGHANGSDMTKGGFAYVDADGETRLVEWSSPTEKVVNTNARESAFLRRIPTSHCSYLYRRDFLERNQIRYPSDLAVGLDLVMLTTALLRAQAVTLLPELIYFYHQSGESAIRGSLSKRVPLDSIRAQERVCDLLRQEGFDAEADARLRRWGYHIKEYWLRIPDNLTLAESTEVFDRFREAVAEVGVPWQMDTPRHQRHLLALILAGRDEEAVEFLSGEVIRNGFYSEAQLKESLEFVLGQHPEDVGSLLELGRLARREGDSERALRLFDRVLAQQPGHAGTQIHKAGALREQGEYEAARGLIDQAIEQSLEDLDRPTPLRRAVAERDRVHGAEKRTLLRKIKNAELRASELESSLDQAARELDASARELDSVKSEYIRSLESSRAEEKRLRAEHEKQVRQLEKERETARRRLSALESSTSWRLTAPLRRVILLVKGKG